MSIISGMLPAKRACKNQMYWTKEMNCYHVSNMPCFHSLPNRPWIKNCPFFSNFTDNSFLSQDSCLTRKNCRKHVDGYCTTLKACRNAYLTETCFQKVVFHTVAVLKLCDFTLSDWCIQTSAFVLGRSKGRHKSAGNSICGEIYFFVPTATRYILV